MHATDILDRLNDEQKKAVGAPLGNSLVLAGAGTGKTRVLTHRIAWLATHERIPLGSILAVTFTNKAANEMRERVAALVGEAGIGRWIGTFHSTALRLLRSHRHEAKLGDEFAIIDADDQLRIIRNLQIDMNISVDKVNPRNTRSYISKQKEQGRRHANAARFNQPYESEYKRIYKAYEERCQKESLVDFGEMLLRCLEMLREHEDLLRLYRRVFENVLVDEFQDTNAIQYDWLKLIAKDAASFMAVGDDDQSIYGWRGAEVANMNRLLTDFKPVSVHRLEQNYRSSEHILQAANSVISHNDGRLGKNLWTDRGAGQPIVLTRSVNEHSEADAVAEFARDYAMNGGKYEDIAVLYRTHALSRVVERSFNGRAVPYRIYGGLRFFERAEIKDALAYMRLVATPDVDFAFVRVVNTPTRGIGSKSIERLRAIALERGVSLFRAAEAAIVERLLPARTVNALDGFLRLLANMRRASEGAELAEIADQCIRLSGLVDFHAPDKTETSIGRRENLQELVNACSQFVEEPVGDDEQGTPASALRAFLDHASLGEDAPQADAGADAVRLMTVHSAKGLEFPVVQLVGVEDGIFPNSMAINEGGLEEERRLFYVAMTRAMKELRIGHAEVRTRYGQGASHSLPSRFLAEIPEDNTDRMFFDPARAPSAYARSRPSAREPAASIAKGGDEIAGIRSGAIVRHAKFGEGIVLATAGTGDNARIQVQFKRFGSKWLVLGYANLQVLES